MNITVYNDGELVHTGTLDEFLSDNDGDEWLVEQCAGLESKGRVEFEDFHSGNWVIERVVEFMYAVEGTVGKLWSEAEGMDWLGFYPAVSRETGRIVAVVSAELETTQEIELAARYEFDEVAEHYWA